MARMHAVAPILVASSLAIVGCDDDTPVPDEMYIADLECDDAHHVRLSIAVMDRLNQPVDATGQLSLVVKEVSDAGDETIRCQLPARQVQVQAAQGGELTIEGDFDRECPPVTPGALTTSAYATFIIAGGVELGAPTNEQELPESLRRRADAVAVEGGVTVAEGEAPFGGTGSAAPPPPADGQPVVIADWGVQITAPAGSSLTRNPEDPDAQHVDTGDPACRVAVVLALDQQKTMAQFISPLVEFGHVELRVREQTADGWRIVTHGQDGRFAAYDGMRIDGRLFYCRTANPTTEEGMSCVRSLCSTLAAVAD